VVLVVMMMMMYWEQHQEYFLKLSLFNSKKDLGTGCLDGFSSSTQKKHY
jgi:hypothetical protein